MNKTLPAVLPPVEIRASSPTTWIRLRGNARWTPEQWESAFQRWADETRTALGIAPESELGWDGTWVAEPWGSYRASWSETTDEDGAPAVEICAELRDDWVSARLASCWWPWWMGIQGLIPGAAPSRT